MSAQKNRKIFERKIKIMLDLFLFLWYCVVLTGGADYGKHYKRAVARQYNDSRTNSISKGVGSVEPTPFYVKSHPERLGVTLLGRYYFDLYVRNSSASGRTLRGCILSGGLISPSASMASIMYAALPYPSLSFL